MVSFSSLVQMFSISVPSQTIYLSICLFIGEEVNV